MRKTAVSKWYRKFFDRDHSPGPPLVLRVAPIILDRTQEMDRRRKARVCTPKINKITISGGAAPPGIIFLMSTGGKAPPE